MMQRQTSNTRADTLCPNTTLVCTVSVTHISDGKYKVWCAGCIRRYNLIAIPERIRKIVIYSQHGKEAAQSIEDARDHLTANDRELKIILPPAPAPMDWNDILQERARC